MSVKSRSIALVVAMSLVVVLGVSTAGSSARKNAALQSDTAGLEDLDARAGTVEPTAQQRAAVERLGARASWNEFGTPRSLIKHGGFLATGIAGRSAAEAAKSWINRNGALFKLESSETLRVAKVSPLKGTNGRVIQFQQRFGDLRAAEGGFLTVGLKGSAVRGWSVAYASSMVTGDSSVSGSQKLTATDAWARAAADVGRAAGAADVGKVKSDREWAVFAVRGFSELQRARLVAVPTPSDGVRPAFETLLLNNEKGHWTAYQHFIDAETGAVLVRKDLVMHSHPPTDAFTGQVPPVDGACDTDKGPWVVAPGESIEFVSVTADAVVPTNDVVLHLVRDGTIVASQDTLFTPETLIYDPADDGQGTYHVRVCDFVDGAAWLDPRDYAGNIFFAPVGPGDVTPYPPKWKVFPAYGELGNQVHPWNYPSDDIREVWCWEDNVGQPPVEIPECDREVQNLASRAPWDVNARTGVPTFTTLGNNANTAEAWTTPLSPGPFGFRPVSLDREYIYDWGNEWHESDCFTPFVPGQSHDIAAAVTNLFVMHNRMHDWSYFLGFTERHWNAQDFNFGTGNTADRDALIGDAQAGALTGGAPSYTGRDNANMISLPDGVPPITNMYLWQPIAGAFYAPCVDGDFDMSVIGHEYGHLIENRMIGKGGTRGGHHAGAMGESSGDLLGVEVLNEYGFVPVSDENPFSVGPYVTGNKQRGIRNYGMNFPRFTVPVTHRPGRIEETNALNFSDMGYDIVGQQVHANGEIWSATNFDIRRALVDKYNGSFPASDVQLQQDCAEGRRPADLCPGNRRWIQIMFDAYLLMPVAPSMLDARDAYLAADMMRFGGANQQELWEAFGRRGFGENAVSTNSSPEGAPSSDTDPKPDFESPLHNEGTVTFNVVASDEGNTPVPARIYAGHYEARVSPIADTDPATGPPDGSVPPGASNLDNQAAFVAGSYDFVVHAPGYGHFRFTRSLAAGSNQTLTISMPTNVASRHKGAVATGDGAPASLPDLIDDTEATNWDEPAGGPGVNTQQPRVSVDLAGDTPRSFNTVKVSAMLFGENRFTALRQFQIRKCTASPANAFCANPGGFTNVFTSPANAFPGFNPRPVAPEMILRTFTFPTTTATHVQIRVLHNQCTGNSAFQGEQDADPLNPTDCRTGGVALPPRHNEVHVAELQVFLNDGRVASQ
ncbi:MAG: M36 family metallopeptidase [Actinomycetota bacterium]